MAYLGVTPTTSTQSLVKQDFSVSATQNYTLSQSVTSANDIALYINNVRQEPTYAYSASGTSLTLTAATAGSDDMYCIYLGRAVGTINPASGSVGTAQITDSAITSSKLLSPLATPNIGFAVKKNSDVQTLSSGTLTKVTFDTEIFDTNNNFANSRFTPTVAGQYFFCADLHHYNSASGATTIRNTVLYKNGSAHTWTLRTENNAPGYTIKVGVSAIIEMNGSSDYVEVYARGQFSSGTYQIADDTNSGFSNGNTFIGFRLGV